MSTTLPPGFTPPPGFPGGTMTEYEASYHTMQAASAARAEAAQMGGDPAQISALLRAAGPAPAPATCIGGLTLHPINLAVTVALGEASRLSQAGPPNPPLLVARMAACFHEPQEAYQLLLGQGLAGLDARALELTAHWQEAEITLFAAYVTRAKAQNPSLEPEAEATPGKPGLPVKPRKPGRRSLA